MCVTRGVCQNKLTGRALGKNHQHWMSVTHSPKKNNSFIFLFQSPARIQREKKKKKSQSISFPRVSLHAQGPWISTESGDREQTGELFQKPHSEDPVSRLMAPILAFHQPASQWTHCSAPTASSGPLTNIIPTARAKIVPLQNIRMYVYKDITTSAIVAFGFRRMFQDEARTQSAEAAVAFPRRAAIPTWHQKKKAGRSFSLQTWQQSVHSKHSFHSALQ